MQLRSNSYPLNPRALLRLFAGVLVGSALLLGPAADARAQATSYELVSGEETTVSFGDILNLLEIIPNTTTTYHVGTANTGPWVTDANLTGDGRLSCRIEDDSLVFGGGPGAPVTDTCFARVCSLPLGGLVPICRTQAFTLALVDCRVSSDALDAGCTAEQPACTIDGQTGARSCTGCTTDAHCGGPDGLVPVLLGEVTTISTPLLHRLLGLGLLAPLGDLAVRSNVNDPYSDSAIIGNDVTCAVVDGEVVVDAGADATSGGTCYVQSCLVGRACIEVQLDIVSDVCLVSGTCAPFARCDLPSNTCQACTDDHDASHVDSGCTSSAPACNTAGETPVCAECVTDADCESGILAALVGPGSETVLNLSEILNFLRLSPTLLPSDVQLSSTVDGIFGDSAIAQSDVNVANCAVSGDGDVTVTAIAASGVATCYVEVCAELLGGISETCVVAPIEVRVDACVLAGTCHVEPSCLAGGVCGECRDTKDAGQIDRGCDDQTPACLDAGCVECIEDVDCHPKFPLVDLDVGDDAVVGRDAVLASLNLDELLVDVSNLQVSGTVDGDYSDRVLLDVGAETAQCTINGNGDVALIASSAVYGEVVCYVRACVTILGSQSCLVAPITLNVDPCVARGDCRPPICDAANQCQECRDDGLGLVDSGCGDAAPACLEGGSGSASACVECTDDSDCASGLCDGETNSCVACFDDSVGEVDTGCAAELPACLNADGASTCQECTVDADCAVDLVCNLDTYACGPVGTPNSSSFIADVTVTTEQDVAVLISVADVVNAFGEGLTLTSLASSPMWGVATIDGELTVLYTPLPGFHGNDHFTYMVCDELDVCAEGLIVVAVTPTHASPIVVDDILEMDPNSAGNVDVLANDLSPNGGDLVIGSLMSFSSDLEVEVEVDGTVQVTPAPDFIGVATFIYTACDSVGQCSEGLVTVYVGVDAPDQVVAMDDGATANGATPVNIDVLANDVAPEGQTLGVSGWTQPAHGLVVATAEGELRYMPFPGDASSDTFRYTACTPDGRCGAATVQIERTGTIANTAPIAIDDLVYTEADAAVTFDPTANDLDAEGDVITVVGFAAPAHGTLTRGEGNTLIYTPEPGFVGRDGAEVTVEDEDGLQSTANAVFFVEASANTTPFAEDDVWVVEAGVPTRLDVLANDGDADGDTLHITTITQLQLGVGRIDVDDNEAAGEFILLTASAIPGSPQYFKYTISDGHGGSATGQVKIYVTTSNAGVFATDDQLTTDEDTAGTVNVLTNDLAGPDAVVTVTRLTETPRHGEAVIGADGVVTYTPDADYFGPDSFTYEACDATGACDTAAVTVTVSPVADAPTLLDDRVAVTSGSTSAIDVLGNDFDVDGDTLTITALDTTNEHGTLTLLEDGSALSFAAPADWLGTITATYEACDPSGLCGEATVTIEIVADPVDAPTATDDEVTVTMNGRVVLNPLDNDWSPLNQTLALDWYEEPTAGEIWRRGASLMYATPRNWTGVMAFKYGVCDAVGRCAEATIRVTVIPAGLPNQAPVAVDDAFVIDANASAELNVVANDTDPNGDVLSVTEVRGALHGTVTIAAAGVVLYTPTDLGEFEDTFIYRVCDLGGLCDEGVVRVQTVETPEEPAYLVKGGPNCGAGDSPAWPAMFLLVGAWLVWRRRLTSAE